VDKYYTYRPMLDLIGTSEGTDKGRGYNETLAYGAYTGGDVDLVSMSLAQIDKLQTRMLAHPKNRWNSSAAGRYQIVRTTRRSIDKTLGLDPKALFNEQMQDRMACYLLGSRGIDKWLSGRLTLNTLLANPASEWASLPLPNGKGKYDGQRAAVTVQQVLKALASVQTRHNEGQPTKEIKVDKPVIPDSVDHEVKKKTSLWSWATGIFGAGGTGIGMFLGADWQAILAFGALILGVLIVILLLRRQIIGAVKDIRGSFA